MAAPFACTKDSLISLLNDIEILSRELFEEATTPQASRIAKGSNADQLLTALVKRDEKLTETLKTASEQAVVQQRIDALTGELEKRNADIMALQRNLNEAETVLASAVFEAKKKLESIRRAEKKAVTTEELIRFAHRISASGAVAAPPTWAPGDPSRRPYPTDSEMRRGMLGKNFEQLKEAYHNQKSQPTFTQSSTAQSDTQSQSILSGYNWQSQSSLDTPSFMSAAINQPMNIKQSNDVEIMSQSDSSSSSSSDEQ